MPTVMVVDDTSVDRRLAGGLIEEDPNIKVIYAESGEDALGQMKESTPDLVVTDLQMPEMDGLQLVGRIRMVHPKLPVILMTARGSEEIAIQALEQGASSYVPKSRLNDMLSDTVQSVLSIANSDKTYADLMACQERIEIAYSLHNDTALIDAVLELVQQFLEGMNVLDHTDNCRVVIAVREALLNALYRGNLEVSTQQIQEAREDLISGRTGVVEQRKSEPPYCDRRIAMRLCLDRSQVSFTIGDEGPGFDHQAIAASDSANGGVDLESGRGLRLMRSFMDEVVFNEAGNEVTLVKRC